MSSSCTLVFRHSALQNSADYGGAIYNEMSDLMIMNAICSKNSAQIGGGMYNLVGYPTIINATFAGNSADLCGALYNGAGATLINIIASGDTASSLRNEIMSHDSTVVSYSLIEGCGGSGVGWDSLMGTDGGNNIDADPMFVDLEAGDLHIWSSSPAIDAGNSTVIPLNVFTDLDGNSRMYGGDIDLGAYEYQGVPTGLSNESHIVVNVPILVSKRISS